MNNLITEIKRIKELLEYENILNESILSSISNDVVINGIKAGLKAEVDNIINSAIKTGAAAAVNSLEGAKTFLSKNLDNYSESLFKKVLNNLPEQGKNLTPSELSAVRAEVGKIMRGQSTLTSKGTFDDIIKQSLDTNVFKASTKKTISSAASRRITKPIQQAVDNVFIEPQVGIEAAQIATKNPGLQKSLDDAAKLANAGTPPPTDRIIPTLNKSGLLQTTKKGGIEITTKNLKRAAFLVGGGTLALSLIGYLLDNGVTVQDDSVGAGSGFDGEFACAKEYGEPKPSTYFTGKDVVINAIDTDSPLGYMYIVKWVYFSTGVYYRERIENGRVTFEDPPSKKNGQFYRYYCEGKILRRTKELVDIDGKPINADTGESEQTQTTQPGSQYSGPRKWRSLGPKYNADIKTALGKSGTDLTDEDIKDIYDRLKNAGKIKN
jgi:hypothetical protein